MPTGTSRNWPGFQGRDDGIARAFTRLVSRRPDDTLVIGPAARATVSDIDRLAKALEVRIRTLKLATHGIVGLAAPNGPAFLAGLVALRRTGHTVLLLDHLAPARDRDRAITAMGACAVLETSEAWPSSEAAVRVFATTHAHSAAPPGTAVIKLTSGSTGLPRGVAMTADHVLSDESALASTMGLTDRDRLLAMVPMSHSYGFTTLALSAIVRGLTLISPGDLGPLAAVIAARSHGATIMPTVPAYIQALLRLSQPPPWPTSLRRVITAGAMLTPSTARAYRRRYGRPIHVFYGSSECGGICYDREGDAAERGTVGSPVDGVNITLVPTCEADGEGLVSVTSPGVGATYVPDADRRLSAGTFETSDVAAWQGCELALRRRADRVINVRGRKVDPTEVERVLAALDGVEDVVVTPTSAADSGDTVVRAIVACPARPLAYETIARWCQERLADHKVPRSIVIVDEIPRTMRGKVDHGALAVLAAPESATGRGDA